MPCHAMLGIDHGKQRAPVSSSRYNRAGSEPDQRSRQRGNFASGDTHTRNVVKLVGLLAMQPLRR